MQIPCSICGKKCTVVPSALRNAGTKVEDYKCRGCWDEHRLSIINKKRDDDNEKRIRATVKTETQTC